MRWDSSLSFSVGAVEPATRVGSCGISVWSRSRRFRRREGNRESYGAPAIRGGFSRQPSRGCDQDRAKEAAQKQAATEVLPYFAPCPRCGRWRCRARCWNLQAGVCFDCAPIFAAMAPASAFTGSPVPPPSPLPPINPQPLPTYLPYPVVPRCQPTWLLLLQSDGQQERPGRECWWEVSRLSWG
jgi:hypothetical protein